jgi:hypothetical protein
MEEGQGVVPDLAGYPSTEELVKAYRASGEEAKRQKVRADQFEQQIRQPVPQRDNQGRFVREQTPEERLFEMGVPTDALGQYVGQAIERAFAPLAQGFQARNNLLSQYQDYNKYENDVAQFVNSDPELSQRYQRLFASDPTGAMEYAYLKFGQTRKGEPAPTNGTIRKEAAIPAGRQSDGQANPSTTDDLTAKGWELYQKTGDPRAYAKARLKGIISDDFLAR